MEVPLPPTVLRQRVAPGDHGSGSPSSRSARRGRTLIVTLSTIQDPTDGTGYVAPEFTDGFCELISSPAIPDEVRRTALANLAHWNEQIAEEARGQGGAVLDQYAALFGHGLSEAPATYFHPDCSHPSDAGREVARAPTRSVRGRGKIPEPAHAAHRLASDGRDRHVPAMGPVATKLLREIRAARAEKVVDLSAIREARAALEAPPEDSSLNEGLPPNHALWMELFRHVSRLAHSLLGSHALRKLARRIEAAEQEYMPGGPPMSPVLDSLYVCWTLCDARVGPRRETLLSILHDVAPALGSPEPLRKIVAGLAASRMGVYRVEPAGDRRVRLEELGTDRTVAARLPNDLRSRGPLWLTRLLPPLLADHAEDWVVWTTPYVLAGPDAFSRWNEYLDRVVRGVAPEARAEAIDRHFRAAGEPTRWLDYVMDAYAGVSEDTGTIVLHGVPDRPETLPHHPDHDDGELLEQDEPDPFVRVRQRLLAVADQQVPPAPRTNADVRRAMGLPPEPLSPDADRFMTLAYRMYGHVDDGGETALDRLLADADRLPAEERAVLREVDAGWFSAFAVERIRLDEGLQVRDLLRRRRLWIHERSATRGLDVGDVVAGWVTTDGKRFQLEGAVCHVPAYAARLFETALRALRDDLARKLPKLGWKKRAGLLAAQVAALSERVVRDAPMPKIANFDGDEILLSTARYDVVDAAQARTKLAEIFESDGPTSFRWISGDALAATIDLEGKRLQIRCNSRRRLDDAKARVERHLGGAVRHRADVHEDPSAALEEAWANRLKPKKERRERRPPAELPPEAEQAVRELVLEQMRRWIDEPIPALDGLTPRQAVRTREGRDRVSHLLFRQSETFEKGGGLPPVDLGEIWAALGLRPPG